MNHLVRDIDPIGSREAAALIDESNSTKATLEVLELFGTVGASADAVHDRMHQLYRDGTIRRAYTPQRIRTVLKQLQDKTLVEVIDRRVTPGHARKVSIYRTTN
ncbi:hypothetical protein [uncultured Mobiluncus sp.]|uniref:hypothetical protein n=1 Tax=uncultured Mobiluncus sp. TaxID=293425 RepID=UPI00261C7C94|nr:hypothetical protein [uncultured Mobiluncus sp.]